MTSEHHLEVEPSAMGEATPQAMEAPGPVFPRAVALPSQEGVWPRCGLGVAAHSSLP